MISAMSILTSTFALRLMVKPSGLGAPQTQRLRLGPHQTNEPSFMGASAHHRRSETVSDDPCELRGAMRITLTNNPARYRAYPPPTPGVQAGAIGGARRLVTWT